MEYALTATKNKARAGSYYDRIARFYDLTFKLNGYGRSLDQYFANHPLPVSRGARILDARRSSSIEAITPTRAQSGILILRCALIIYNSPILARKQELVADRSASI